MQYNNFALINKAELGALGNAVRTLSEETDLLTIPQMTAIISNSSEAVNNATNAVELVKAVIEGADSIVIPDYITVVGKNAFYGRTLKSVTIPSSVTALSDGAFDQCTMLTSVDFTTGCEQLGRNAFRNCAFTYIFIPESVNYIGNNAFANCANCITYDFSNHTSIPSLSNINAFNGINSEARIIVPQSLYDDWKVATNWANYSSRIYPYIPPIFRGDETTIPTIGSIISHEGGVRRPLDAKTDGVFISSDFVSGTVYLDYTPLGSSETRTYIAYNGSLQGSTVPSAIGGIPIIDWGYKRTKEIEGKRMTGYTLPRKDRVFITAGVFRYYAVFTDTTGRRVTTGSYVFNISE